MALTVNNIVAPGPCKVYIAPYSPTSLEAAPANSVAYGSDWSGGWVEVGFTVGGALLKTSTERLTVEVDQVNAPVTDFITKQLATISFVANETTLTNMKQALGYGTITSGSTESTLGVSATDGIPTYYTVGFESYGPVTGAMTAPKYRRIIGWKCMPMPEVELKADKNEQQQVAFSFDLRYESQATSTERLYKIIDRVV